MYKFKVAFRYKWLLIISLSVSACGGGSVNITSEANNKNLNIEQNIDIQNILSKTATILTNSNDVTLNNINDYITELYYYELFNDYITNVNKKNITYDFVDFFNTLGSSTITPRL